MSEPAKATPSKAQARARKAIEAALDVLDAQGGSGFASTAAEGDTPFVSLLEQCETLLDSPDRVSTPVSLLWAMPGVPALAPDWWTQRFGGLAVRQLADSDAHNPAFSDWLDVSGEKVAGILLTAPLDAALPQALQPDATACVVCHPYVAFQAMSRDFSLTLSACPDQVRESCRSRV
mgnify:CR=1 FL=1